MTEALVLLGFVLPLGLDSFAVAAATGAAGVLAMRDRWRITALFVVFEAGMPLVGLSLGAPLAHTIGPVANYVAAAAVVAIGLWMLLPGDADDEEEKEKAERLVTARVGDAGAHGCWPGRLRGMQNIEDDAVRRRLVRRGFALESAPWGGTWSGSSCSRSPRSRRGRSRWLASGWTH